MGDGIDVVIPMAIHQVGDDHASALGEVGRALLDDVVEGDGLDEDDALLIGREEEALDGAIGVGELLAALARCGHGPDFAFAGKGEFVIGEPDGGRAEAEEGVSRGDRVAGRSLRGWDFLDVEEGVAAVFFDAVVGDLIGDLGAVGRYGIGANAAHSPEGFGGEGVGCEGDVATCDDVVVGALGAGDEGGDGGQDGRGGEDFQSCFPCWRVQGGFGREVEDSAGKPPRAPRGNI